MACSNMRVFLVISGSGEEVPLGTVDSLASATGLVQDLDRRFEAWEAADFPTLPAGDPLLGYEGCDVCAEVGDVTYIYADDTRGADAWERFGG